MSIQTLVTSQQAYHIAGCYGEKVHARLELTTDIFVKLSELTTTPRDRENFNTLEIINV